MIVALRHEARLAFQAEAQRRREGEHAEGDLESVKAATPLAEGGIGRLHGE
jgi:hypothetical protein